METENKIKNSNPFFNGTMKHGKGWAKKLKNRLNRENRKKITEKTKPWKKTD